MTHKLTFLTPGPTQLHPEAEQGLGEALQHYICSISHRSEAFRQFYMHAEATVRQVLGVPSDSSLFFLTSSTEAMERMVENCSHKQTFHVTNGHFSTRFERVACQLGRQTGVHNVELGHGAPLQVVQVPHGVELVSLAHLETSGGVALPVEDIVSLRKRYPEPLIIVDVTSSVPYTQVPWESVDAAFFSVQKGFGLPAGLAVLIVNGRCLDKSAQLTHDGVSTGSYHSFASLWAHAEKHITMETPNVLNIYLLGRVAEAFLHKGVDVIRQETDEKADMLFDFFAQSDKFPLYVADEEYRARTVVAVRTSSGSSPVIEHVKETAGIVLGSGYGDMKEELIRIANFPMHTKGDIERALAALKEF